MSQGSGDSTRTTGQRIQHHRQRAGMSRTVFGGLLGRSESWVKGVETGRLLAPRIQMLIRIAAVLQVDLAELVGGEELSTLGWGKAGHEHLQKVADALQDYSLGDGEPVTADQLAGQVHQAWTLWHGSRRQRTAVSVVLPDLIRAARTSARRLDGADRRRACALLAQVYHLAQLFLSWQPVPDLILLTGDRAMTSAQEADDPRALAASAWYLNHVFRDAGTAAEARITLATETAAMLRPDEGGEDLALWGLLQLAVALSHAKTGRAGEAWGAWDEASRAARALGDGYSHPWLIFGPSMVDAYAVTMHADLFAPGEAVRVADRLDLASMPSATRRSFHLAETARVYQLRREPVATLHMLRAATDASPDTSRFSPFTRQTVAELRDRGGATVRSEAARLAAELGVPA